MSVEGVEMPAEGILHVLNDIERCMTFRHKVTIVSNAKDHKENSII
jgi:hypothetical protein